MQAQFFCKTHGQGLLPRIKDHAQILFNLFSHMKKYMKKINASISEDKNESMNFYIPWHDL